MDERNIDLQNVADTLNQYSQPYVEGEPTPESQEYIVSDQELKTRKMVRWIFMTGVLTLLGVFIYAKYKK